MPSIGLQSTYFINPCCCILGIVGGVDNVVVKLQLRPITDDPGSCFMEMTKTFDVPGETKGTRGIVESLRRSAQEEMTNLKEYFATGKHASKNLVMRPKDEL